MFLIIYFWIKNLIFFDKTPSYVDMFCVVVGYGGFILAVDGWSCLVVDIFWL